MPIVRILITTRLPSKSTPSSKTESELTSLDSGSSEGTVLVWERLRAAFPLTSLETEGVILRPLEADDLERLTEILSGDPEMTWPRITWTVENARYLLGLRLQHYERYGFGVYGIEGPDGGLIGMGGPQVWRDGSSDIEVLAYVEKKQWSQGTASVVLKWTLVRAFEIAQIEHVFAATRPE